MKPVRFSLGTGNKNTVAARAHEKECAMFRELVHGKLDSLDKRMWRLEAMIKGAHFLWLQWWSQYLWE